MKRLLQLGIICCSLWLAGCGGGGDGGGSTPTNPTSRVQIAVNWPERGRAIAGPSSALSFSMTLQGLQTNGGVITVQNRGANIAAHTQTYNVDVTGPRQQYPFRVDFFAGENASGEVVATAGGNVTLSETSVALPDVSLTGTVASVTVPTGNAAFVGETTSISAQALDAEGHVVAVSPGSFVWNVTAGSDRLERIDGGFRGIRIGLAEITASIDGKTSVAVPMRVGQRVVWRKEPLLTTPQPTQYLAFKDGTDPWFQVPLTGATQYEAIVFSEDGRYGWAWMRGNAGDPANGLESVFRTTAETVETIETGSSSGPNERREVRVRVLSKEAGEEAFISDGSGVDDMGDKTTRLMHVNVGATPTFTGWATASGIPTRMTVRFNLPTTVDRFDLDLRGEDSFDFESQIVSGPDEMTCGYEFIGSPGRFTHRLISSTSGEDRTFYVPNPQMTGNEIVSYFADMKDAEGRTRSVSGQRQSTQLPQEVDYPDFYNGLIVTRLSGGEAVRAFFPYVPGAITYTLSCGGVSTSITAGWAGTQGFDFTTPKLADLPGAPGGAFQFSPTITARYRWANLTYQEYQDRDHRDYDTRTAGISKVVRVGD